jgi:hypothetical protein
VSVISRKMISVPVRTSVETWTAIVDLLTSSDEPARDSLEMIGNVAAMLIAEEYTREAPIVVVPIVGDRVRIYTVHGTAAVEAEDTDETPLATWPLSTAGWTLSLPCGIDDIDDVRAALRPYPFAAVRDMTEGIAVNSAAGGTTGIAPDPAGAPAHKSGAVVINYNELERP